VKRWITLITAVALAIGLTACSAPRPEDTNDTVQTAPPLLKVDLKNLLTPEQIGDAIGAEVGEPMMYEENTWAHYTGIGSTTTVDISLDEATREVFDAHAALYPDRVEAPHLAEESWWNAAGGELLSYGAGYMISVQVHYEEQADEDMMLMATRHLTALLIERLQQG
jgi:hypothetical protein